MNKAINLQNNKAYTLLEVLLYLSIATVMLGLIAYFLFTTLQSRVKGQAIVEVEEQSVIIMDLINETILEAEDVNEPSFGNESNQLNLTFSDSNIDPTLLFLDQNNLYIQKGSADPILLNSDNIKISNLKFTNTSRTGTTGLIRIQFDTSYNSTNNKPEFNYSQTFYSGISLREKK